MTQPQLLERAKEANALISLGADKLDKHFFSQCSHLEAIAQFAVGYDNIDVNEATRMKIPVSNTPDVLSDATADVAFGLMIAVSRKMFYLHKSIELGEWKQFEPLKTYAGTIATTIVVIIVTFLSVIFGELIPESEPPLPALALYGI